MTSKPTYSHLDAPYRPRAVRAFDRACRQLGLGGAIRADRLIDRAKRSAGLTRFASEAFVTPLTRLCESLEGEAMLSPTGRILTEQRLTRMLVSRLRADDLFARHPEIDQLPIREPLVVTGLQRSGTTLLHRLLSSDPASRAVLGWEGLDPAPVRGMLSATFDPRPRRGVLAERALRYLAPDFLAVRPVAALAAEEEITLMDHSFLSTVGEATYHVPSYASWLQEQDQRPAYRYLKRMLKLLAWQQRGGEGRSWVLKTPHHLENFDALFEVFPDARVIWTHRDPVVTVASFCSMVAHGRGVFSDHVEPAEIGRHWLAKIGRMLGRATEERDRGDAASFFDVAYRDLLRDPLAVAETVYKHAGKPLDSATTGHMRRHLSANPQHRHGRHRYRLEDFGLDASSVADGLASYRTRYARFVSQAPIG